MKMFELFYEMKHTPFTRSIPTSVLYRTHQSSEVFSRLEYTARNQLFAVLIGEPGLGKTSTLRRLKDERNRQPDQRAKNEPRSTSAQIPYSVHHNELL